MDALFRGVGVFGRPRIGLIFTSQFGPWRTKSHSARALSATSGMEKTFSFPHGCQEYRVAGSETGWWSSQAQLERLSARTRDDVGIHRVNIRGTSLRRSWSTRWQGGCATADSISERIRRGGRYLGSYGTHPGATPTSQMGRQPCLMKVACPTAAGSGLFTLSGRSRETRRQLLPSPARSRPQAPLLIRMPI